MVWSSVKGVILFEKVSWKKSQEVEDSKLGIATMFSDFLPSAKNLIPREGSRPVDVSVSIVVSENLMIAFSLPDAKIPV